jgi:hypothetical protein
VPGAASNDVRALHVHTTDTTLFDFQTQAVLCHGKLSHDLAVKNYRLELAQTTPPGSGGYAAL